MKIERQIVYQFIYFVSVSGFLLSKHLALDVDCKIVLFREYPLNIVGYCQIFDDFSLPPILSPPFHHNRNLFPPMMSDFKFEFDMWDLNYVVFIFRFVVHHFRPWMYFCSIVNFGFWRVVEWFAFWQYVFCPIFFTLWDWSLFFIFIYIT